MKRASIHIYGYNADVDAGTEDIWGAGGAYSFPSSSVATTIVSDDDTDAADGNGAKTVAIIGLDSSGYIISETATLTGTDAVTLTNAYWRVNEAYIATAGSGGINTGNVTIGSSDVTTIAYIPASEGQTQQAIYTVPADYDYATITQWYASGVQASGTNVVQLQIRPSGGAWRTIAKAQLSGDGVNAWYGTFDTPYRIYPRTDVRLRGTSSAANSVVWGGFDIELFD